MKKLVIVGAGGFSSEVEWLASRCGREVLGFIADGAQEGAKSKDMISILGAVDDCVRYLDSDFIIAIGSPKGRASVYERLKNLGVTNFATLVDPSVILGNTVSIGRGSIVCAGVIGTTNIAIGEHVILNLNTTIGHDVTIEDFSTIAPGASISGNVEIRRMVEIGTGADVREKIIIESGSVLGMGSVVVKNVGKSEVVVGNPAKAIE